MQRNTHRNQSSNVSQTRVRTWTQGATAPTQDWYARSKPKRKSDPTPTKVLRSSVVDLSLGWVAYFLSDILLLLLSFSLLLSLSLISPWERYGAGPRRRRRGPCCRWPPRRQTTINMIIPINILLSSSLLLLLITNIINIIITNYQCSVIVVYVVALDCIGLAPCGRRGRRRASWAGRAGEWSHYYHDFHHYRHS